MNYFMKKYSNLLLCAGTILLAGCGWFSGKNSKPELIVMNVLDEKEFNDCHITGSIQVSFEDFEDRMSSWDKKNHYVIYCANYACMSSGYCAKLLKNAKFEHVWAYEGGMAEWYQKGYPSQGPAQSSYLHEVNEPLHGEHDDTPIITAQELLAKMEEFTFVK